jgi:hypothetical protein
MKLSQVFRRSVTVCLRSRDGPERIGAVMIASWSGHLGSAGASRDCAARYIAALLLTLMHTFRVRSDRTAFLLSLVAFLCLAATQGVFWMFTYPINVASNNWGSRRGDTGSIRTPSAPFGPPHIIAPRRRSARLGYWPDYSITSSARPSSCGGRLRPRAFAALRLTTSSNFAGAWTGRSAGFVPLRIRSTYHAARRCMSP